MGDAPTTPTSRTWRLILLGALLVAALVAAGCRSSNPAVGSDAARADTACEVLTGGGPGGAAAPPTARSSPAGTPGATTSAAAHLPGGEAWAATGGTIPSAIVEQGDNVGFWVQNITVGKGFGVNADTEMIAASTIKLLALAAVLEYAQAQGRELSGYERSLAEPMIQWSDNDAASALIDHLEAVWQPFSAIGASWGVPGAQNPQWGLSPVSARRAAGLAAAMFDGTRLDAASQAEAWRILALPDPDFDHDWRVAVGFGLPDGWTSVSKVGTLAWGPYGLHVHGVGVVRSPTGHRYAIAVLSRGWGDYSDTEAAFDRLNEVGRFISTVLVAADAASCQGGTAGR